MTLKVDRDRFLLLTAVLATGVSLLPACTGSQPPAVEDPAAKTQPPAVQTVPVAANPTTPPPATTTAPPAATTPSPVAEGGDAPSPAAASGGKGADPYKGTPITAQACNASLNATGTPPACDLKAPGPTCESFADTKQECPTLKKLLKPRVAQAAIECLRRKSGTQEICEFNVTSICAYEALQSACLDPSAKAACNAVVAKCGPPKGHYNKMMREACEAGVSGIADAKRAKFISCISESCRFETCLTYL